MCSPAWVEATNREIAEGLEAKRSLKTAEVRIHNLESALAWAIRHMKIRCAHGETCPVVTTDEDILGRVVPIRAAVCLVARVDSETPVS